MGKTSLSDVTTYDLENLIERLEVLEGRSECERIDQAWDAIHDLRASLRHTDQAVRVLLWKHDYDDPDTGQRVDLHGQLYWRDDGAKLRYYEPALSRLWRHVRYVLRHVFLRF
jgi:hypothetical protein